MNFLQRCWQRRWIRGLVWTFVTLVTLGALLLAWVNWTGAREWNATQAMLKAEGETIDFRATMNDPVPEAENYCAIPLLKDLALVVDHDINKGAPAERRKRLETLKLPGEGKGDPHPKFESLALGRRVDLKAWADWLNKQTSPPLASTGDPARDILAALSKQDAALQELAEGLERPKAQWTPEWKTRELPRLLPTILLPHDQNLTGIMQMLTVRAEAAARVGDTAQAHEIAQIIARLVEASLNDPFLIGLLIGASGTSQICTVTWELCADHAGTTEDFARLESTLARLDFPRSTLHAWRGEMATMVSTIQYLKGARSETLGLFMTEVEERGRGSAVSNFAVHAIAGGFFDANAAVMADREFQYMIKPLRDEGLLAVLESGRAWEAELNRMNQQRWKHPSYVMTAIAAPATTRVISRVIYAQALRDQAIIGCALERYHLAHGSYPDSLDTVKLADGKALPVDIMNGQPMGYRLAADGKYALWSVGFDRKDDGGQRVLDAKHPENTKFSDEKYLGDWVWDFPAN